MRKEAFREQMTRLQTQWPTSYGPERTLLVWDAFKDVPDLEFKDAVSYCLGAHRTAPLVKELGEAVGFAKSRNQMLRNQKPISPLDALEELGKNNRTADPEFVKCCIKLLRQYHDGEINHRQFLEGCNLLDSTARQLTMQKAGAFYE